MKKSFDGKTYSMEEEIEDFNWRPEYPNVVMKTTSIIMQSSKFNFISHSGLSHIALIFIFPTRNGINEWDICIVHHPCQDEQSAMNQLLLVNSFTFLWRIHSNLCQRKRDRTMRIWILHVTVCISGFPCKNYEKFSYINRISKTRTRLEIKMPEMDFFHDENGINSCITMAITIVV